MLIGILNFLTTLTILETSFVDVGITIMFGSIFLHKPLCTTLVLLNSLESIKRTFELVENLMICATSFILLSISTFEFKFGVKIF